MARSSIQLPGEFSFTCSIPVRITDINYGGHAGNDALLSLLHEARMQWLGSLGYTEMEFAGASMIMRDVTIEFKNELFYGDTVLAAIAAAEISKIGFDLVYKLEKDIAGKRVTVVLAKTGMLCYDYKKKKIVALPEEARRKLLAP